jgi:hypothetical protein
VIGPLARLQVPRHTDIYIGMLIGICLCVCLCVFGIGGVTFTEILNMIFQCNNKTLGGGEGGGSTKNFYIHSF